MGQPKRKKTLFLSLIYIYIYTGVNITNIVPLCLSINAAPDWTHSRK